LQPPAKNARRIAEKGVSGRASKEGRRAVGPSEGEGLRKAAMRSESGVQRSSGLHLVAACDAHNQQLVSRRRILKYNMYTMIQALDLRATAGRAAAAGHRPGNARCFRFREGSAPRAHWRRGTTTHPPHSAPGPAERASTVQPTILPPRSGMYPRGKSVHTRRSQPTRKRVGVAVRRPSRARWKAG